jgi:hypothetical protein
MHIFTQHDTGSNIAVCLLCQCEGFPNKHAWKNADNQVNTQNNLPHPAPPD